MTSLLTYCRTLRHLRCRQIVHQLRRRMAWLWERPEAFAQRDDTDGYPGCLWRQGDLNLLPPATGHNCVEEILAGKMTFLNLTRTVDYPPAWRHKGATKLWHYNLHYFDYLWLLDYGDARDLVRHWIETHRLGREQVGWEPYPISLRLMNWCGVFWGRYCQQTEADTSFVQQLWRSMHLQACWLERHLEHHLLGNHLLENAAALAVVGSCFAGRDAQRWARCGRQILAVQLPEQILADGAHFERSPMYQLRVMYVLTLLLQTQSYDPDIIRSYLQRMATALQQLCHPDGAIALLNDAAHGIYPSAQTLLEHLRKVVDIQTSSASTGSFALSDSGYYGYRNAHGDYLLIDAAPLGPDYMVGHGHADMLSFELSLAGRRVIVDSGVYDYSRTDMRRYCRSTEAHNTVQVDGKDQCELWAVFRCGRRGHCHDVQFNPRTDGFDFQAGHDGYRRLPARLMHTRRMSWQEPGELRIVDQLEGQRPFQAVSRLHLHPDCRLIHQDERVCEFDYGAGMLAIAAEGPMPLSLSSGWYCPEFGRRQLQICITQHLPDGTSKSGFTLRWNSRKMDPS